MSQLSYRDWTEAIGRHVFHTGGAGREVRFSIDPIILQLAAAEYQRRHQFQTPEKAAEDFQAAVIERIRIGGWDFGAPRPGMAPYGLAKLALQVLAVFHVEAEDARERGSYWRALNGMFGEGGRNGKPRELTREIHLSAWGALENWVNIQNRGKFGNLSAPPPSGRSYIRFPMHHGLLRMEDFKALPRFFKRAELTPGEEIEPEELEDALREHAQDASVFPRVHARRVLQDGRLPLAAVQIANALAQWDGSDPFHLKSERRSVRIWFSIPRREANLVRGGLIEIKPGADPVDVPGVALRDILGKHGARGLESPVCYQPIRGPFVLAVYSPLEQRCIEARGFDPGDQIILARPRRDGDRNFEQGLRKIATGGKVEVIHPDPSLGWPGWVIFQLEVRDDVTATELRPLMLEKCLKFAGPRLRVSGGKRAGRPWLEGDGPTLTVFRGGGSATVIVDGLEYETINNQLTPANCSALGTVGSHEAWIPGRYHDHVRFRVDRPAPPAPEPSPTSTESEQEHRAPPAQPTPSSIDGATDSGSAAEVFHQTYAPAAWIALQLATALRRPNPARRLATAKLAADNFSHPNLLVRQLARALTASEGGRNG